MNAIKRILLVAAVALPLAGLPAALRLNQYYGSNAVLQRGVAIPVSGTATAGATVSVSFNGTSVSGTADANGAWTIALPAQQAGGPYTLTVTCGSETLTSTNVKVGEVWLVGGQSNAYYPIERFASAADWLDDADCPNVHFIMASYYHVPDQDQWQVASSATAGKCSAMGFFFAKELQKSVNVPVGVVTAAHDGSWIAQWFTDGDRYKGYIANSLDPIPPFPVKGVLWYQGESDGMYARGYEYRNLLTRMIGEWRTAWNAPNMPFIVVQLPLYGQYELWYEVRDSQNWVGANVNDVYVVQTLDIGDMSDIHPPKKPELGVRLSAYARKYVYGETGLYPEGPVYKNWEYNPDNNSEILVHFDTHSAITSSDGQPLRGFQVGGDVFNQRKYLEGTVRIVDGNTVAVSNSQIENPLCVRYGMTNGGFSNSVGVNFFDAEGNSARAFRTDDFKLPTQSETVTHEHGWRMSVSGSVLSATCTNANCKAGTPTLSISGSSSKVYDGKTLVATLAGTDFAALTISSIGPIEYYQGETKLSGAPVEIGTYEARVEVEHENSTYVLKKTLTITEPGETPQTDDPAGAIAATGDATGVTDVGVIQAAINAAKPNGTVTLGSGIYYINTQLLVEDGVTLQGQGWDKTIIKQVASGADCRVATVDGGSTVKRMALTGGRVETTGNYKSAGGVALKNGTISWCCITNNLMSAGNSIVGGGIGIYAGKGQIDHSIIADNTVSASGENAVYGGGIGVFQASGAITVDSCLIYGNTSVMTKGHRSGKGGGIGVNGSYNTVNVRNTTIVGNVAGKSDGDNTDQSKGGAVYCDGGKFNLTNCILWGNDTAQNGYDVDFHNTTVALDHCLYATSEYTTDLPGSAKITACATTDPKFTDGYALASDSPAKGTGVTYTGIGVDLTGADFANPPSMGCYEFGSVPGVLPDVPGGEDDPQVDPPAVKKCGVGLFID